VRHVLVQAAWAAIKTPGPLRAFYQRVQARRSRSLLSPWPAAVELKPFPSGRGRVVLIGLSGDEVQLHREAGEIGAQCQRLLGAQLPDHVVVARWFARIARDELGRVSTAHPRRVLRERRRGRGVRDGGDRGRLGAGDA
jgi:hypothetical protein